MQAVGVGSFSGTSAAATAAASAAAIRFTFCVIANFFFLLIFQTRCVLFRWVSKDGIGALGRLLIGRETMARLINVHGVILESLQ